MMDLRHRIIAIAHNTVRKYAGKLWEYAQRKRNEAAAQLKLLQDKELRENNRMAEYDLFDEFDV